MLVLFQLPFVFFVFYQINKKRKYPEGYLSRSEQKRLRKKGLQARVKFVGITDDVPIIKSPMVRYLHFQDLEDPHSLYKQIIILNSEYPGDFSQILEGEVFVVYKDLKNPQKYFVDLQDFLHRKGNIFILPRS